MEFLTPEEIADLLKVEIRTVREWLKNNQLRGAKLGSLWRVKKEDLEKFIEERMNS